MQLTKNDIILKLKDILIQADPRMKEKAEKGDENTDLFTELGLNSVSMLYMVISIEEDFGIRFDDVSVNDFVTIGDVADYILKKKN